MTHVDVSYRLIQPAGHHRRPRSAASWTPIPGGGSGEYTAGTHGHETAPGLAHAAFVFWSVSDGTDGSTQVNPELDYTTTGTSMQVTGWFLPSGDGGGPPGPPGFLIDAFSVARNDFVDDIFVTITPDGSLTTEANDAGFVPTDHGAQVAHAVGSIGPEGFDSWIGASSSSGADATFDDGASGFAVATYRRSDIVVKVPDRPASGGRIIGGVGVDGGGAIIIGGVPIPVDPWGPLLERLFRGMALGQHAARLDKESGAAVTKAAITEIQAAARAISKASGQLEKR